MKSGIMGIAVVIVVLLASMSLLPFLFAEESNIPLVKDLPVDVKKKCITLIRSGVENRFDRSFTLASLPLYICGIGVDVSIKCSTRLKIMCELEIAGQSFKFTLNDPSFYFKFDFEDIELDGKLNPNGLVYFDLTIDTDGILESLPKLVLYHYSLDFK